MLMIYALIVIVMFLVAVFAAFKKEDMSPSLAFAGEIQFFTDSMPAISEKLAHVFFDRGPPPPMIFGGPSRMPHSGSLPPMIDVGLTFGKGGNTSEKAAKEAPQTPVAYRNNNQIVPEFLKKIFYAPNRAVRKLFQMFKSKHTSQPEEVRFIVQPYEDSET